MVTVPPLRIPYLSLVRGHELFRRLHIPNIRLQRRGFQGMEVIGIVRSGLLQAEVDFQDLRTFGSRNGAGQRMPRMVGVALEEVEEVDGAVQKAEIRVF